MLNAYIVSSTQTYHVRQYSQIGIILVFIRASKVLTLAISQSALSRKNCASISLHNSTVLKMFTTSGLLSFTSVVRLPIRLHNCANISSLDDAPPVDELLLLLFAVSTAEQFILFAAGSFAALASEPRPPNIFKFTAKKLNNIKIINPT
jgi:hypothetical protein